MTETLKKIKGTKDYFISDMGNVYHNDKKLKPRLNASGRRSVKIKNYKGTIVSFIVAKHFLRNPNKKIHVKHKDGNLLNDNVSNLEWSYLQEFSQKAIENRRKVFKEKYMGKKHWKSRPFTIDGKKFNVLREATEYTGTDCLDTIKKRLMIPSIKNYKYCK